MSDLKDQEELRNAGDLAMRYVRETKLNYDVANPVGTIIGFLLWYWKQQNENKP